MWVYSQHLFPRVQISRKWDQNLWVPHFAVSFPFRSAQNEDQVTDFESEKSERMRHGTRTNGGTQLRKSTCHLYQQFSKILFSKTWKQFKFFASSANLLENCEHIKLIHVFTMSEVCAIFKLIVSNAVESVCWNKTYFLQQSEHLKFQCNRFLWWIFKIENCWLR